MSKVLIVYATRAGGAKKLAEMIADGIKADGHGRKASYSENNRSL